MKHKFLLKKTCTDILTASKVIFGGTGHSLYKDMTKSTHHEGVESKSKKLKALKICVVRSLTDHNSYQHV